MKHFAGWISILHSWLHDQSDLELSMKACKTLANLDEDYFADVKFREGVFLYHPQMRRRFEQKIIVPLRFTQTSKMMHCSSYYFLSKRKEICGFGVRARINGRPLSYLEARFETKCTGNKFSGGEVVSPSLERA